MQFSLGLLYDLLFVCILLFGALHGRKRGFVAGLFGLVGTVFGIFGAICVSQQLAAKLYADYLGKSIGDRTAEAVAEAGGDLGAALQKLDFLPESVRSQLGALLDVAAVDLPVRIVDALEPLLLPLIQVVVFVVICLLIRLVFHLIGKLLQGINHVPLVGGLNRALGLLMGLVAGALDCWLVSLVLWFVASVFQGMRWLSLGILHQSWIYNLLAHYNPFLTYY